MNHATDTAGVDVPGRLVDDTDWLPDPRNAAQLGLWDVFTVPGTGERPNHDNRPTGEPLADLASGALRPETAAQLLDALRVLALDVRVLQADAESAGATKK